MTLKTYTDLQAEIDALNEQKAQVKAATIKEIAAQMDAMDIAIIEIEAVQVKKGFLTGPNGEIWSGKGRRPLWYVAQLESATAEPAPAPAPSVLTEIFPPDYCADDVIDELNSGI